MLVPEESSNWVPPLFIVDMPLNAKGEGPETDKSKVESTAWQIWDQTNKTICEFSTEEAALTYLKILELTYE